MLPATSGITILSSRYLPWHTTSETAAAIAVMMENSAKFLTSTNMP